jgi:hypothetical protein
MVVVEMFELEDMSVTAKSIRERSEYTTLLSRQFGHMAPEADRCFITRMIIKVEIDHGPSIIGVQKGPSAGWQCKPEPERGKEIMNA